MIVGANICLPQLRQNASPKAAGVPQCGQIVAFRVGSLIILGFVDCPKPQPDGIAVQAQKKVFGADASIEKDNESQ